MLRLVAIVYALFQIVSKVLGFVWEFVGKGGWAILLVGALLFALKTEISDGISFLQSNWSALYSAVSSAGATASSLVAAGWPSWLADGYAFVDHILPVSEAFTMCGLCLALKGFMVVLRIIKSMLPQIAT